MGPNNQFQDPTPAQELNEPEQKPNDVLRAGTAIADYGATHSTGILIFIKRAILWLVNFIRFVIIQMFQQIINK